MPAFHVVLLSAKSHIPEERVNGMLQALRDIRSHVPGLLDVKCGKNKHADSHRFPYCIVVIGEDEAAIERYRRHPLHGPIAEEFVQIELDSGGCDFTDGD